MATDKKLVRDRFEANFGRYDRLAHVQQQICEQLVSLMVEAGFAACFAPGWRVLEVGAGTGFLTGRLVGAFPGGEWFVNDLAPAAEKFVSKYLRGENASYLWGDAEELDFPDGLSLVASASTIQWFDDVPAFIARAAAATLPGGWLVLSTFGGENFREIRATTGEGLDYLPLEELCRLFAANGYEILHAGEYQESLAFDTPADVLRHIKATGVNSLSKNRWTRGRLAAFTEDYTRAFSTPAGVTLTYHPILLIGRKR